MSEKPINEEWSTKVDDALALADAYSQNPGNVHILSDVVLTLAAEVKRLRTDCSSVYNGKTAKEWYEAFAALVVVMGTDQKCDEGNSNGSH